MHTSECSQEEHDLWEDEPEFVLVQVLCKEVLDLCTLFWEAWGHHYCSCLLVMHTCECFPDCFYHGGEHEWSTACSLWHSEGPPELLAHLAYKVGWCFGGMEDLTYAFARSVLASYVPHFIRAIASLMGPILKWGASRCLDSSV